MTTLRLVLFRDKLLEDTTLGILDADGKPFCQTLEDADRRLDLGGSKIPGRTAIPCGTYPVIINYSRKFGREMPLLLNVPQFEGIRIHSGYSHEDTDGCIVVGSTRSGRTVLNGRATFAKLFALLENAYERKHEITIEVRR